MYTYSRTSLFRTRLIRSPAISKEDRMPLDLPFPFTLPRLFRSPAISNFFPFPLGLRNSGVRLYMQLLCEGITSYPRAVWDMETSVYLIYDGQTRYLCARAVAYTPCNDHWRANVLICGQWVWYAVKLTYLFRKIPTMQGGGGGGDAVD